MGRWLPKEERLKLGERAAHLRDVDGLQWKDIAERLGLHSGTNAVYHYKKYKAVVSLSQRSLTLGQIEEFSCRYGIERGYVWLYERGFKRRVPLDIQQKIEDAKLGISHVKGGRPPLLKVDKRKWPRKRGRGPIMKERSY